MHMLKILNSTKIYDLKYLLPTLKQILEIPKEICKLTNLLELYLNNTGYQKYLKK